MTTGPARASDRFTRFPRHLAERSRIVHLAGDVPALLAHPDWSAPAPVAIWLHGRTVNKETDPGRYLRWVRAGVAACALDLPGHGERFDERFQTPDHTLEMVRQAAGEIDGVIADLRAGPHAALFDTSRIAIGGMSAGGMVALHRLCSEHPFRCAVVEAAAGSLGHMPHYLDRHGPRLVAEIDPAGHLGSWRPIPLLSLHSETDEWVPVAAMRSFIDALRARYRAVGADPGLVEFITWPKTGAPHEHIGFGRFSNDAKAVQAGFLAAHLGAAAPSAPPAE